MQKITVIFPTKNEASGLTATLPKLNKAANVDDGSTDDTEEITSQHEASVISHLYPMGNGAAIKSGTRTATGNTLIFMYADRQHYPEDIPRLTQHLEQGYDMVIGAHSHSSQANIGRIFVNSLYNRLASYMTGQNI